MTKQKRDYRNEPTYWFAILEMAREAGDLAEAVEASDNLKRLGVQVVYERSKSITSSSKKAVNEALNSLPSQEQIRRRIAENLQERQILRDVLRLIEKRKALTMTKRREQLADFATIPKCVFELLDEIMANRTGMSERDHSKWSANALMLAWGWNPPLMHSDSDDRLTEYGLAAHAWHTAYGSR